MSGAKIVIHFVPLNAFEPGQNYELHRIARYFNEVGPLGVGGWDQTINFEGLINQGGPPHKGCEAYAQLFRSGIVEAVNASILAPSDGKLLIPSLHSLNYELKIIDFAERYLKFIKEQNISLPVFAFLTLIHVKEYAMEAREIYWRGRPPVVIDRENLMLPEFIIENYNSDLPALFKPAFD